MFFWGRTPGIIGRLSDKLMYNKSLKRAEQPYMRKEKLETLVSDLLGEMY